jgi:cytidine deaminase
MENLMVEKAQLLAMMAAAMDNRQRAYALYSQYHVGAAVMGGSGKVYLGCNVENASYGLTVCAERVAIWKAISEGEEEIRAVAIAVQDDEMPRPCGACLQVMSEFAPEDEPLPILTATGNGEYEVHTLDDYLPMPFLLEP